LFILAGGTKKKGCEAMGAHGEAGVLTMALEMRRECG
jgi:hypothetical protein